MAFAAGTTASGNDFIDGLLFDSRWGPDPGSTTTTVTYSFPDHPSDYMDYPQDLFNEFVGGGRFSQIRSAPERDAIDFFLRSVTEFTQLRIVELTGTADASANIRLAHSSSR